MKPAYIVKIKARDIVSGWPRGHSTGGLGTYRYEGIDPLWFHFWGKWKWSPADLHKLEADALANQNYHDRQQRMFDDYVERYRRLTEHGECLLDPGYVIFWGRRTPVTGLMKLRSLE